MARLRAIAGELLVEKTEKPPVQLLWSEQNRKIVITTRDSDRFVLTMRAAIAACRAQEQEGEFEAQYNTVLDRLAEWIEEHKGRVATGFVTIREADLLFVVVRDGANVDREFEDQLTELDVTIATDPELNLVMLSVLSLPTIPEDAIKGFLNEDFVLEYANA